MNAVPAAVNRAASAGVVASGSATMLGAAEWICLGATPVFAIMGLLTAVAGNEMEHMHAMHGGLPLSGMAPMYLLMSLFHSAPWLRRIRGRRGSAGDC